MKRPLKITLLVAGTILAVLIVGIVLVPVLFRDQIVERLRVELNEQLDATVSFSEVDVSLLSTFPTLTAEVTELSIAGEGDFAGTTLLSAQSIAVGLDLLALIFEKSIGVESIEIEEPVVHVVIDQDGRANYDIIREQPETRDDDAVALEIKRYRISKGSITYDEPGIHIHVDGLEHDGRAKISGSTHELSSETTIDALTARLGGITYLKEARMNVSVDGTVDTEREHLTLTSLELAINQLALEGSGKVGWTSDGTDLDVELASKKGLPIKALISAIPNAYAADFAGLKASGAFTAAATIQGQLGPDDDDIPSFTATVNVRDGAFKYPDLPLGISNLNLDAKVTHPGGNLDKMRVEVPKYNIAAGKSHARGHLTIARPLSQRQLDLKLDGRFDLAEISKAYPIPDVEALEGLIVATIDLKAKGEQIEKLNGNITVSELLYHPSNAPAVRIRTAGIELSPESTKVKGLQAQVAESDLTANGLMSPLTTLWGKDQTITGSAWLESKRLRVEDFLSSEQPAAGEQSSFVLPDNLDAKLAFDVGKLTYGDLVLENFKGNGRLRDRKLIFEDVRANALGGSMKLDGSVTTPVKGPPTFDVTYAVDKVRFADAFEALPSVRAYAPIARFLDGRFSTDFKASGILDENLSPSLESIDASGLAIALQSKLSSNFKPLAALNDAVPAIPKPLDIEGFRTRFKVEDGAIKLAPSKVQARGILMEVSGTHGLDQEMKYQVTSEVPLDKLSSKLAKEAQALRLDLSKAKSVGIRANLTGSIQAPRVSVDLDTKALRGAVADAVSAQLAEQRARAMEEANKQANRLIAEAEKRADQLRSEAAKAAEKVRKEGYARAAQVEREGAGNPLKAIAAKEGAKRIRSETDKRANQLVAEADKRAKQTVAEARKRADQTLSEADKRSGQGTGAVEKQTDKTR
ncbi:MAG: AsmA family protein [Myxococcales bacterium]|nr:AsmA family protein [Myxococcales bacterium]MDH3482974.1 AsmA family protein [Myxococcales bacterium]